MKLNLFLISLVTLLPSVSFGGWINELHYDNAGADANEAIEIVLAPGELIGTYSVVLYNGNTGNSYATISSFAPGVTVDGYSYFSALFSGIQNGNPDGLALLSNGNVLTSGGVVQFLSYEGTFTAANGPVSGLTSTDIGVSENSSTLSTQSLQLLGPGNTPQVIGPGTNYSDFAWSGPLTSSIGAVNVPEPSGLAILLAAAGLFGVQGRRRRAS